MTMLLIINCARWQRTRFRWERPNKTHDRACTKIYPEIRHFSDSRNPVLDRLRRRQSAREVAELIGESVKLATDGAGMSGERSTRSSARCPILGQLVGNLHPCYPQ